MGHHLPPARLVLCQGARALRIASVGVLAVTGALIGAWGSAKWDGAADFGGVLTGPTGFGVASMALVCMLMLRGLRGFGDGVLAWDGRGSWTWQPGGTSAPLTGHARVAMDLGRCMLVGFAADDAGRWGWRWGFEAHRWMLPCRGGLSAEGWSAVRATLRSASGPAAGSSIPWST